VLLGLVINLLAVTKFTFVSRCSAQRTSWRCFIWSSPIGSGLELPSFIIQLEVLSQRLDELSRASKCPQGLRNNLILCFVKSNLTLDVSFRMELSDNVPQP